MKGSSSKLLEFRQVRTPQLTGKISVKPLSLKALVSGGVIVGEMTGEGNGVGEGVGEGVGVGVRVGVGESVGVGVKVGASVRVGDGETVNKGVGVGVTSLETGRKKIFTTASINPRIRTKNISSAINSLFRVSLSITLRNIS